MNTARVIYDPRCGFTVDAGRHCRNRPDPTYARLLDLPEGLQVCRMHGDRWMEMKRREEDANARKDCDAKIRLARESLVYYLQRASDSRIKIGFSADVHRRQGDLRRDHGPLDLLATHKGGRLAEGAQHKRFDAYRVEGEWFEPAPELLAHIDRIRRRRARTSRAEAA